MESDDSFSNTQKGRQDGPVEVCGTTISVGVIHFFVTTSLMTWGKTHVLVPTEST